MTRCDKADKIRCSHTTLSEQGAAHATEVVIERRDSVFAWRRVGPRATGITMPITKHNYIVKDVADLADTVREAFIIARQGRPGPVLIDIPKDVTAKAADFTPKKVTRPEARFTISEKRLGRAVALINESKRPLIYSGGGVVFSDASDKLKEFLLAIDAPAVFSMMGLSALKHDDPQNLGMVGMHGTPAANGATIDCDLLIAIGAGFSDRVSNNRAMFAKNAKIIHIDIDSSSRAKTCAATSR